MIDKGKVKKDGKAMKRLAMLLKKETPRERALRKLHKTKNTY